MGKLYFYEPLAGLDVRGTVTTMDSLLCQRAIAGQIVAQHGHYLMVVKENQPALFAAIDAVFRCPPPAEAADQLPSFRPKRRAFDLAG